MLRNVIMRPAQHAPPAGHPAEYPRRAENSVHHAFLLLPEDTHAPAVHRAQALRTGLLLTPSDHDPNWMHVHSRVHAALLLFGSQHVHVQMSVQSTRERNERPAMTEIRNGMPAEQVPSALWRRSRHSGAVGNCVEVAELTDGGVAMRNSRHPGGPALIYTRAEIAAFLHGAKDGEFDDLVH